MYDKINEAITRYEVKRLEMYPTKPKLIISTESKDKGQKIYDYITRIEKYTNRCLMIFESGQTTEALISNLDNDDNPIEIVVALDKTIDFASVENISHIVEL